MLLLFFQLVMQQNGWAVTEPICSCNRSLVIKCKIHPGHEVLIQPGGSSKTFTARSLWKDLLIFQADTLLLPFISER